MSAIMEEAVPHNSASSHRMTIVHPQSIDIPHTELSVTLEELTVEITVGC